MRYALVGAVAACLLGSAAFAGPDSIKFPEDYKDTFTHYSTVNRADERKQVVKIYANDAALASARPGAPLESGSVLVMEVYKAKLDAGGNPVVGGDGFFEQDELAAIAVMETRSGWGADYSDECPERHLGIRALRRQGARPARARLPGVLRVPQAAGRGRLRLLLRRADQGGRQLRCAAPGRATGRRLEPVPAGATPGGLPSAIRLICAARPAMIGS